MTPSNHDPEQTAAMILALVRTEPTRRLDTLACVAKLLIEGKLGLFEAVVNDTEREV